MKNLTNLAEKDWPAICASPSQLYAHIRQTLDSHTTKSFTYSQGTSTDAAVLIPLFFKNDQAHILFTKRTTKVATHKGQISFPGGRADQTDPDLIFTALRETEEEVGIKKEDIALLGQTDVFQTNTDFLVTPYVGTFNAPYPFEVSADEIDRLIEVPLIKLLDKNIFRIQHLQRDGWEWQIHYYNYLGDVIWGVTGFLLSNFLSITFGLNRDANPVTPINPQMPVSNDDQ